MMLKALVLVGLLATCLSLPVDEALSPLNPGLQPLGPPRLVRSPAKTLPGDAKPNEDLKADPTFWFGYGYPFYRRTYYYAPRYHYYWW